MGMLAQVHISLLRVLTLPTTMLAANSSLVRQIECAPPPCMRVIVRLCSPLPNGPMLDGQPLIRGHIHSRQSVLTQTVIVPRFNVRSASLQRWTQRLRGLRVATKGLLYVKETQIMTLEGEQLRVRFSRG